MAAVLLANNGQPVDEDYEKAVHFCSATLLRQMLNERTETSFAEHGQIYDEAQRKCREAIGDLMRW